MASMVKEKRKQKKKSKEKDKSVINNHPDLLNMETPSSSIKSSTNLMVSSEYSTVQEISGTPEMLNIGIVNKTLQNTYSNIASDESGLEPLKTDKNVCPYSQIPLVIDKNTFQSERIIQELVTVVKADEIILPSAPVFDEQIAVNFCEEIIQDHPRPRTKPSCMKLEDAMRFYGGQQLLEVQKTSEKEELLVEAGPLSGPEHPLVDLLSTYRSSLLAVERERAKFTISLNEEEKIRNAVWKIEKRSVDISEKCQCDVVISFRAEYSHATLLNDKLSMARMRQQILLKDIQESYCFHQHTALLTFYQIEEVISDIVQYSKRDIREALSLVLQALRLSDSGPAALASALERWAVILSNALLQGQDIRDLLFLLHHLFRQSRSVRWATKLIQISIGDSKEAAYAIALLDLIFAKPRLTTGVECTEEELWEEVDEHGSGAVSDGALRERDLLALLHILPLRDLVARLVMFTHRDIKEAREHEWGDKTGGHGVIRAAAGVRTLLHALRRAVATHPCYGRLRRALYTLATSSLHALSALHLNARDSYSSELADKVAGELEACFVEGASLLAPEVLHELPTILLSHQTCMEYCMTLILTLHDKTVKQIDSICIDFPVISCEMRVRIVAQAGIDRFYDHQLAKLVVDFLVQNGLKRKRTACKGTCDLVAQEYLTQLLDVHPYLHTIALHKLADSITGDTMDPLCLVRVCARAWRPMCGEIRAMLEDWATRCPQLVQHLLLHLDYTPNKGLSLESQMTIGSWLCDWFHETTKTEAPEWAWRVLRCLRVHRTFWNTSLDAPAPDFEPHDLFSTAFVVLSTSWGHSIPLICEYGIAGVLEVARARPLDATYCLAPLMLVMSLSPDSVALTPEFGEVVSVVIGSGASLLQRALGRSSPGPALLMRPLLAQLALSQSSPFTGSSVLSAWTNALWQSSLPAALSILDSALLSCREWPVLDAHINNLLQSGEAQSMRTMVIQWLRTAERGSAVVVSEAILRGAHTHGERVLWPRLLTALRHQHLAGRKIHVDNALKEINADINSDDLMIYKTAASALAAPLQHPSQISLWRFFFHLYLQRSPEKLRDSRPIGPLFFSGIINSRTIGQIKKRLQETVDFHHNEAKLLKASQVSREHITEQNSTRRTFATEPSSDGDLFAALSIVNLKDSSESVPFSDVEEEVTDEEIVGNEAASGIVKDSLNLLNYHIAAERLIGEYLRWLEAGEHVRAEPYHGDITRYISEQALRAAWDHQVPRSHQVDSYDEELPVATVPKLLSPIQADTPFRKVMYTLLKMKNLSPRRSHVPRLKSLLADVNLKNSRSLFAAVDKHLSLIETMAREWREEELRVSALDAALWDLVRALYVPRPLPDVTKSCVNRCAPITVRLPYREWCTSVGAERGIIDNRASARAALRRLARPRPDSAKTAAALQVIARSLPSRDAVALVERALRTADAAPDCALAQLALNTFVTDLAERWVCSDGSACAELVSRWGGEEGARQVLCAALVRPRRLCGADWPRLYSALLTAPLSPHAAFSYLSKFEMGEWSSSCEIDQRREMLDTLLTASQKWECAPRQDQQVLLELIGVHTAALLNDQELSSYICRCARASLKTTLPASYWIYIVRATNNIAHQLPFDQLGNLLRELGVIWWEARSKSKSSKSQLLYDAYAPHLASLLQALERALVSAAFNLSYETDRVAWLAWSALHESWSPWVSPIVSVPPLLQFTGENEAYTPMLRHFVDTIQQLMLDCPDSEETILQHVWDWTIQSVLSVISTTKQTNAYVSSLLIELTKLPWNEHRWFNARCMPSLVQATSVTDAEMSSWCARVVRGVIAQDWMRPNPMSTPSHSSETSKAAHLAALFYVFTTLPMEIQTINEAQYFPWSDFPIAALEEALERYFTTYHNASRVYHAFPHFSVLLYASELRVRAGGATGAWSRDKRAYAVSRWTRAACSPTLQNHVAAQQAYLLDTFTQLAPHLQDTRGEIEELMTRAAVIMCIEPAATVSLSVWQRWVRTCEVRMCAACVSAAGAVTAPTHFAALADAAAKALLLHAECDGWAEISERWRACAWTESVVLARRRALYASYGLALAHPTPQGLLDSVRVIQAAAHDFVENELILCVWTCASCRAGVAPPWGDGGRRSLLQLVSLQPANARPTPRLRLLSRLVLCILNPGSDSAIQAYETSCIEVLGSRATEVSTWGRYPHPRKVPLLAITLFPSCEKYFRQELNLTPEEDVSASTELP